MQNVKLMQKLGEYIQLAGNIAGFVPEPHVQAIHNLLTRLGAELQGGRVAVQAQPYAGGGTTVWNPPGSPAKPLAVPGASATTTWQPPQ